jgi:hypothetical protein
MRQRANLIEDPLSAFAQLSLASLAADHLRVAGNNCERVLEFVSDTC